MQKLSKKDLDYLQTLGLRNQTKTSRELHDKVNTMLSDGMTISSITVCRNLREQGLWAKQLRSFTDKIAT